MKVPILLPDGNRKTNLLCFDAILHSHYLWELTVFTSGVCKNTINGKEYMVSEGYITILGPNHTHSIVSQTPSHTHRDIFIEVSDLQAMCNNFFDETFYKQLSDPNNPVVFKLSSHFAKELDYSLSLLDAAYIQQGNQDIIDSIIRSIIAFLLGQAFMNDNLKQNTNISWLTEQLSYLRMPNVFNQRIESIIKNTGYSHSQYLRKFKEAAGTSLVKYLIDLRISHAQMLLRSTSKSILEISLLVGYDSINYFIRVFKVNTGMTPLQYRTQRKSAIQRNDNQNCTPTIDLEPNSEH